MNERNDSVRTGIPFRTSSPARLKLVISGVAVAAGLAVINGSIAGVRAAEMTPMPATHASASPASTTALVAGAVSTWSSQTSRRAAGAPPIRRVAPPAPATPAAVRSTPAAVRSTPAVITVITPPRNRLIGRGLDVGVSTYSDCTGRTPLPRTTVAIDLCITRDTYFVGHSFGGPFTGLTNAYNGETLTWYDAAGAAHRYIIEGQQYTRAYGPADIPPPGTAAQFQTCLTPGGSRIVTFYAVSR